MTYYLEDHPNPYTGQFGWPRTRVSGVIGVHTTESGVVPAGADPGAENTAAFIARRSDYGSYHMIADWDTIVPMTRPTFAAWADTTNNAHALSVSGAMNAARWRDLSSERAAGIVRNMGIAAAMLVRDAIAHGVLADVVPARRITAQEAISGSRAGFYGHGETNPGTRYDPGTNFDWDLFLATYAAAVGGGLNYQSITVQEDDMATVPQAEWEWAKQVLTALSDNAATKKDLRDVVEPRTLAPNEKEWQFAVLRSLADNVATKGDADRIASSVATVAALKASEGATVEQITEAVKQAIAESVVKVAVSVEGQP